MLTPTYVRAEYEDSQGNPITRPVMTIGDRDIQSCLGLLADALQNRQRFAEGEALDNDPLSMARCFADILETLNQDAYNSDDLFRSFKDTISDASFDRREDIENASIGGASEYEPLHHSEYGFSR